MTTISQPMSTATSQNHLVFFVPDAEKGTDIIVKIPPIVVYNLLQDIRASQVSVSNDHLVALSDDTYRRLTSYDPQNPQRDWQKFSADYSPCEGTKFFEVPCDL